MQVARDRRVVDQPELVPLDVLARVRRLPERELVEAPARRDVGDADRHVVEHGPELKRPCPRDPPQDTAVREGYLSARYGRRKSAASCVSTRVFVLVDQQGTSPELTTEIWTPFSSVGPPESP